MNSTSLCCKTPENQIFNHNFVFPNRTLDFPAGWHKFKGHKTADFCWEIDSNRNYKIGIKNSKAKLPASICQEPPYSVPVYEKQVWEIGAELGVHQRLWASVKVHFSSRCSSRVSSIFLDFMVGSTCDFYSGIVTVPPGVDYALIEIGTSDAGTLWIGDVLFRRVFPVEKYDVDPQGRLNINNVASVTRILEPVDVKGTLELVRPARDFVEDVTADTIKRFSTMQDVFPLSSYSFCVINQGSVDGVVGMQLSPNGTNWVEDPIAYEHVAPGQMSILVYNRFARYVRLRYRTDISTTNLRIYFQGQG
jgi:hypothetical protein